MIFFYSASFNNCIYCYTAAIVFLEPLCVYLNSQEDILLFIRWICNSSVDDTKYFLDLLHISVKE